MSIAKLLLCLELHGACVLALLEHFLVSLEHRHCYLGVLVVADGGNLRLLLELSLYGLEVLKLKLGVDDFLVLYGVYACAALTYDVVVIEAAEHVDDGVSLTDVSEELIAETLALGCTLNESGDVYYLAGSGNDASRMNYLGESCESLVGHCDDADVRLDCTEREVGCLCLCVGEAVEECGLSHVRESYDTAF